MSKYVLDKNTALVLNGEVYVLAREKKVTTNSVCAQCTLYDMCIDFEDNHHLSSLCLPNISDGRWFFLNGKDLSIEGTENLLNHIEQILKYEF